MGFYLNIVSKDGCHDQINDLWSCHFSGWLIYTKTIIQSEIHAISKDPTQRHLLWIDSIDKWNSAFPIYAEGRGQIFLRAFGYSQERANQFINKNDGLISKVKWLLDHRLLFQSITGLQDAAHALHLNIPFDAWEEGQEVQYVLNCFDNLPYEPNNRVYQACYRCGLADLWSSFIDWRNNPCWTTWETLRHFLIPGDRDTHSTVWQLVERIAESRDGIGYGLAGRYRDGNVPPETDVVKAILVHFKGGDIKKRIAP